MHEKVANWLGQIDTITADFQSTFGGLSEDQLNYKLSEKGWSIAQNVDHLIVINSTYFPIAAEIKSGTYQQPFLGKLNFLVSFMGRMLLSGVQPDRKKRTKTFPLWEPQKSMIGGDILERFEQHQVQLKQMIVDLESHVISGLVISSPANQNIVYRLEDAFNIIIAHEKRHFQQAKEVLSLLR